MHRIHAEADSAANHHVALPVLLHTTNTTPDRARALSAGRPQDSGKQSRREPIIGWAGHSSQAASHLWVACSTAASATWDSWAWLKQGVPLNRTLGGDWVAAMEQTPGTTQPGLDNNGMQTGMNEQTCTTFMAPHQKRGEKGKQEGSDGRDACNPRASGSRLVGHAWTRTTKTSTLPPRYHSGIGQAVSGTGCNWPYHEVFRGSPQPLKAGINAATVPQVLIVWLLL